MPLNIGCSILAGGKNSRLSGFNKALIKIDNCSILKKNTENLKNIFEEIILVTNSPDEYYCVKNKYTIINDEIKNIGPLGGIYSALRKTQKEALFFVPCDMPFLNNDLILKVIDVYQKNDCDAIVPRIGKNIEPIHSVYRKNISLKLYKHIIEGKDYSIRSFLKKINVIYLDLEDNEINKKIFTNINTPEDLEKIKYRYTVEK